MAIEFHCPYCTAPIQVADDAAGKPGRCPRCATKLTVPTPPRPLAAAEEVVLLEAAEPDLPAAPSPANLAAPIGVLPNPTLPTSVSPLVRRVKRRGRRNGSWWIPILCGGLLFGGVGWYVWRDVWPKSLGGKLVAESLEAAEIPPVLVSLDRSRLPHRQLVPLLEALESEPIPLLSDLMQVQIRGAETGLLISINPGPKTGWYRVDPHQNPGIAEFVSSHAVELERPRQAAVDAAAAEFIEQYAEIRDGKTPEKSVADFRDRLALTALVSGLGYHVAATVGDRHYPCVAETNDGHLYFLLPRGLRQFELAGRKHSDGPLAFPGKFMVTVTAGKSPELPAAEAEATPETMAPETVTPDPMPEN